MRRTWNSVIREVEMEGDPVFLLAVSTVVDFFCSLQLLGVKIPMRVRNLAKTIEVVWPTHLVDPGGLRRVRLEVDQEGRVVEFAEHIEEDELNTEVRKLVAERKAMVGK